MDVISRTLDDRYWLASFEMDDGPIRYYLYDREGREARFLFTNRAALEGLQLAKMSPEVITSRDGLPLVSYLSLPAGSDAEGRLKEPVPLVLYVHGGPWSRDVWGYHPIHQLLANRGYGVLSVNFRGSTGFGKEFTNAANREWGGKMHEDLLDAVEWAVREGITTPDRIAIMGGSYGGYATLVGVTMTPEVFTCGVDYVGSSNLITWMENVPPYWLPYLELVKDRVGDHETEEGRAFLRERSPLTHVDKIQKPLLIAQGANDPRVRKSESDQIVEAMREKGIPVTYALFPDEGHGFARPENRLVFFALTEVFLSQHLGGRCEPITAETFSGSSAQLLEGAERLPGLEGSVTSS
jgi:dipeptidyl aminopeptidase/acylaminoacyl peptidase